MTTCVLVTGGFDPLHSGHIAYFKASKELAKYGGKLYVGCNSDDWLRRKKVDHLCHLQNVDKLYKS